jgi:NADH-quinone oxidoreductase subunit M
VYLSILLWLPLAAGLVAALLPRRLSGPLALLGSLGALGYAIAFVVDFSSGGGLQFVTDESWISELGIHYKLGLDGLNLFLVLLTAAAFPVVMLWSVLAPGDRDVSRDRAYYFHLALGETAVLGALMAQDLALFVVFFDLMLVPFFFLTGIFGGPDRIAAVTKLFIYTLVGSLLMLAAAIAAGVLIGAGPDGSTSFVLSDLFAADVLGEGTQKWIFLCFAAAFLVKMPAFPFHGWMPDGYRAMPLPVLAVFSGVLSKVAAYGFLKIAIPLFPAAAADFQLLFLVLALASILYGSAMAFTTTETRLILGYSSIAQLGFIVLGAFALEEEGAQGAILQSVNHGLVTVPAFFIVALLAARAGGSSDLRDMGGIAFRAPVLAGLFLVVALATLAMPGSSNFAGEFLILLGVFRDNIVIALVASTGVVMASVYALRLFIRSMHNRVGTGVDSREISLRDGIVLVPAVLAILALALYPQVAIDKGKRDINGSIGAAQQAQSEEEVASR